MTTTEEPINRTVLVHLNVALSVNDGRSVEDISSAIKGALEVGSDDESMEDLDILIVLAEEV